MKLALLQLNSTNDMAANIVAVEALVARAAEQGAELVATPENTFLMEAPGGARNYYTQDTHPGVQAAIAWAKKYRVWLLIGSVAVLPSSGEGEKTHNRSLLINPEGKLSSHYDKLHLFDVEVGDGQTYRESAKVLPGDRMVVTSLRGVVENKAGSPRSARDDIKLGMTICYDLRFPQLYRALAKAGAEVLAVPAAFTHVTGEAHWHILLRARAIENGCFVIAPAQTGTHAGGRKTFGHSLVVDPWGKVLVDGATEVGVVMCDIDLEEVQHVRRKLPSLEHDRVFS